ncbi:MAG TPA: hypothetical protein DCE41_19620 [Cytophagales bacterium]|nr:hypothetical protein [Cytophagales bacterium]HAA22785.1 hypothetical protein [Cytophagales bacterium]HAP63997.1 hypothetical protein [Cytophagales bacterium]
MKKLLPILILTLGSILIQLLIPQIWWAFLLVGLATGAFVPYQRWGGSPFGSGFIAGALVWLGYSLLMAILTEGTALGLMGELLLMPTPLVVLAQGVLGGILLGLATYTGARLLVSQDPQGDSLQMD